MKNLLFVFFLFTGFSTFAQSTTPQELTFSRVILTDTGTVPLGKVWKVESYLPDYITPSYVDNFFYINGRQVTFYTGGSFSGGGFGNSINIFPFWLPAGTTIESRKQNIFGQGTTLSVGQFSILEFNVN
jgi:hypothetical protein